MLAARLPTLVRAGAPLAVTPSWLRHCFRRKLVTLAIETSCDDTSVAVVDDGDSHDPARILYHERVTANSVAFNGIHPLVALGSHERGLAGLVQGAVAVLGAQTPDFVSVTRGPGMRACLNTGLNTAKGLCVAWARPMVGVHHMQAHALTPRLVAALGGDKDSPAFPFVTLLVSGGHTMIVLSKSLTEHFILATTLDVPIGNYIDKVAREILPPAVLESATSTMYGQALEDFAFPSASADYDYDYHPHPNSEDLKFPVPERPDWRMQPPLTGGDGSRRHNLEFSYAGLGSEVLRIMHKDPSVTQDDEQRRLLARAAMRVAFEHLALRLVMALQSLRASPAIGTVVVSGGVAANNYLRTILAAYLRARGLAVELRFPPPALCTDNAAMIGWAGLEMFRAGWTTELGVQSLDKWSLDGRDWRGTGVGGGGGDTVRSGILAAGGWRRYGEELRDE